MKKLAMLASAAAIALLVSACGKGGQKAEEPTATTDQTMQEQPAAQEQQPAAQEQQPAAQEQSTESSDNNQSDTQSSAAEE